MRRRVRWTYCRNRTAVTEKRKPPTGKTAKSVARFKRRVNITSDMRTSLEQAQKRTNLKAKAIRKGLRHRFPELAWQTINLWLAKSRTGHWKARTCNRVHYDAVIRFLAKRTAPFHLDDENRRDCLIQEMKRTRVGTTTIRKGIGKQYAELTVGVLDTWITRKANNKWVTSTCRPEHYAAVMTYLATLPDAFYLDLDGENRRTKLIEEMRRTGLGARAVCTRVKSQCPNLKWNMISNWITKKKNGHWITSICHRDHYQAVLAYLTHQPSKLART